MPSGSWAMFFIAAAIAYDIAGRHHMRSIFWVFAALEIVATLAKTYNS